MKSEGCGVELVEGLERAEVVRCLLVARRWGDVSNRVLAFYLHEVERRRLHSAEGYPNARAFAVDQIGVEGRRAQELLAMGRRLRELVEVDAALAAGRLTWSKARAIVRVAVPETEKAWIEFAVGAKQRDVELRTKRAEVGQGPDEVGDGGTGLPTARFVVAVELDAMEYAQWEAAVAALRDEVGGPVTERQAIVHLARGVVDRERRTAAAHQARAEAVDVKGEAEPITADAAANVIEELEADRKTPTRMRAKVLDRDGHACARCGGATDELHVHHVRFRSEGGRTELSNLISVCARCHGLVHDGLLQIVGDARRGWQFTPTRAPSIDYRAPGARIDYRAPGARIAPSAQSAPSAHRAPGARKLQPGDLTLDDIPREVTIEWWRAHEHLLEWNAAGTAMRLIPPNRKPK